jgi:hypothetical protein
MSDPTTRLHYAANGNFVNGVYAPGADGFNLADVGSVSELNALPSRVKGLVYLGLTNGADANFQATVSAFIDNPNLYGFYIADEPGAGLAANLKAEADWIHANVPGAKTFMVEQNVDGIWVEPEQIDVCVGGRICEDRTGVAAQVRERGEIQETRSEAGNPSGRPRRFQTNSGGRNVLGTSL